jgi:hypothetical protein
VDRPFAGAALRGDRGDGEQPGVGIIITDRGRRVNAVSPRIVDTPWWDGLPADQRVNGVSPGSGPH